MIAPSRGTPWRSVLACWACIALVATVLWQAALHGDAWAQSALSVAVNVLTWAMWDLHARWASTGLAWAAGAVGLAALCLNLKAPTYIETPWQMWSRSKIPLHQRLPRALAFTLRANPAFHASAAAWWLSVAVIAWALTGGTGDGVQAQAAPLIDRAETVAAAFVKGLVLGSLAGVFGWVLVMVGRMDNAEVHMSPRDLRLLQQKRQEQELERQRAKGACNV